MSRYRARKGSSLSNADAELVGAYLEELGQELTPEVLVSKARNKKSPIHKFFNWDDKSAAQQHRLAQARRLIRSVEIVVEVDHEARRVPMYHSLVVSRESAPSRRYVHFDSIVKDDDSRRAVLDQALNELVTWQKRYRETRDVFGGVHSAIDEVVELGAPA